MTTTKLKETMVDVLVITKENTDKESICARVKAIVAEVTPHVFSKNIHALNLMKKHDFDLMILDISTDNIDFLKEARCSGFEGKVIYLTNNYNYNECLLSYQNFVSGYCLKNEDFELVLRATLQGYSCIKTS